MWLPVLETLPAPEWFGTGAKLAYIAVVRLVETVLGNVFVWSGAVFYAVYARGEELWGISPLGDQGLAGRGDDDRGLARHDRRARVALPAARRRRASCGRSCSSAASIRAPSSAPCGTAARRSWTGRAELTLRHALDRRPPRRPRRLLDRAQPAVLPRPARPARLPPHLRGRGRARRDDLVLRRAGQRDRAAAGAEPRRARPLPRRPAPPRARGGVARRRRRAARLARRAPAPRSRAGRRSTATRPATTPSSSTTRTGIKLEIVHVPGFAA